VWRWRPEQPTAGVFLRLAELPWVGPSLWRRSPRRAPPKGGELQVRVSSANAHSAQSSGTNHLAGIVDQPPRTVLPCRPPSVPSSAPRSTSRRGFPLFGGAARGRPLPFEALTPKSASKGRRAASSRILRSYSLNALRRHKSYSWGFASTSCSSPALSSTTRPSIRPEAGLPRRSPLFGGAALGRPLPFEALTTKSASKGRRTASSRILHSCSLNALRRHKSYS